jgi:hypothetical protein
VPPTAALQDSIEVAGDGGRVTLVGVKEQVRPAGVEADTVRPTLPAKPFRPVIVIVDVPLTPGVVVTMAGVAAMVKSTKLNMMGVVWLSVPSVPATVTVNVPAIVEVHDSVAVCGLGGPIMNVTLLGDIEQISGAGAVVVSAIVPRNPFTPAIEMVEVAAVVPSAGAAAGVDALIVKSTTRNMMAAVV